MKFERAPRSKKRISCDLTIDGHRYKGIVLDISASGLFIQTNVKRAAGVPVEVALTLPGMGEPVIVDARVTRKKAVPAALLTAAGGGIGLSIAKAPKAYLDFVSEVSPMQAEYMASAASEAAASETTSAASSAGASDPVADSSGDSGPTKKHFRIHAAETATGRRNTFLAHCGSKEEAAAQMAEQLGDEWRVNFIETV